MVSVVSLLILFYQTESKISPHFETGKDHTLEDRVTIFLDASLDNLPTNPEVAYIIISAFPNFNWNIACESDHTNFSCAIGVRKLKVYISEGTMVNDITFTIFVRRGTSNLPSLKDVMFIIISYLFKHLGNINKEFVKAHFDAIGKF